MRISDWSSDVCSSDLHTAAVQHRHRCDAVDDGAPGRRIETVRIMPTTRAETASIITRGSGRQVVERDAPGRDRRRRRHLDIDPQGLAVGADRKSVVQGKRVSVRVDLGGRRIITKKKHKDKYHVITVL